MGDILDILYILFGKETDYDKIIQDCEEKISEKQEEIRYLEQQINFARLAKERQRKANDLSNSQKGR